MRRRSPREGRIAGFQAQNVEKYGKIERFIISIMLFAAAVNETAACAAGAAPRGTAPDKSVPHPAVFRNKRQDLHPDAQIECKLKLHICAIKSCFCAEPAVY